MLLDNFYTILSSESSDSTIWTIQIKLNPGHPVYQGHFPEHPVVPGVCLLQLIKECVEDIRQQKLQVTQVSSCKSVQFTISLVEYTRHSCIQKKSALSSSCPV